MRWGGEARAHRAARRKRRRVRSRVGRYHAAGRCAPRAAASNGRGLRQRPKPVYSLDAC